MMPFYYILDGKKPVPCDGIETWGQYMRSANRHVRLEPVGKFTVSTVFLGIDHGVGGRRILFETMIYRERNGDFLDFQDRCATWEEAEVMHEKAKSWLVYQKEFLGRWWFFKRIWLRLNSGKRLVLSREN